MMTRVWARAFGIAVAAAILLSACGSPDASTTTQPPTPPTGGATEGDVFLGADGVETVIEDTTRIVALNGDITETIFALGAGDRVVGIDLTTTFPPEATTLPDIGLSRDLNAEEVIGLAPTLVIGDTQVQPDAAITRIREAGIPVVIIQAEVTLEGVPRKIRTIGGILSLTDEADLLADQVEADIEDARALAEGATETPTAAFIYVRGPETLLLFGNGMPTHFLIQAAHAVDAAGEVGVLFAENLSAETLVTAQPEVLLTPLQGFELIGGIDAFLALPGVADTPAGRDRRVYTYDEALFLGMGPRVAEALTQLIVDLHPELAE